MAMRLRCLAMISLLVLAWCAEGWGQDTADSSLARLAPTASPPWNPPEAIAASEPWERAVRLPGRLISLPFSMLGMLATSGLVYVEDNDIVPKIHAHVSVLRNYGLLAGPARLGPRTGTGVQVGIYPVFFPNLVGALSMSTRGYTRGQVALETGPSLIEYQSDWRPRDPFFGTGPDSREADVVNYASQSQRVRVELRVPFRRAVAPMQKILDDPASETDTHQPAHRSLRVWAGPRDVILLDGRDPGRPSLATGFPGLAAEQLEQRVEHFVYGFQAQHDSRSGRPHWWRGWRLGVQGERYDMPLEAFAFHSASTPSVPFTRWTWDAETAWSFWHDPRTFRFLARAVDQVGSHDAGVFVIPDLASLGGRDGLSGFEPGRFHDADLVAGRVTYIFPIARYFESEMHVDAGSVLAHVGDARLDRLETSYGVALRLRNAYLPLAFAGVDWSRETLRFRFSIGGVE